jgi:hypothetical protein
MCRGERARPPPSFDRDGIRDCAPRSAPSLEKPTGGFRSTPAKVAARWGSGPSLYVRQHGTREYAWQESWKHTYWVAHPHYVLYHHAVTPARGLTTVLGVSSSFPWSLSEACKVRTVAIEGTRTVAVATTATRDVWVPLHRPAGSTQANRNGLLCGGPSAVTLDPHPQARRSTTSDTGRGN